MSNRRSRNNPSLDYEPKRPRKPLWLYFHVVAMAATSGLLGVLLARFLSRLAN